MTEEEMMLQEELTLQEASDAANTTDGTTATTPQDRPQKLTALLKDIMARRSITPAQLAASLGLNPSNVTGFLQGKKNPTLSTIDRFAEALGTPAWMLLNTPAEVIADLRTLGLLPDAESPAAPVAAATVPSGSPASEAPESPASGLPYDLLTVDPQTGETRLYRLVKP
jgi:transcriptional regulator with XRE-family HTH domain